MSTARGLPNLVLPLVRSVRGSTPASLRFPACSRLLRPYARLPRPIQPVQPVRSYAHKIPRPSAPPSDGNDAPKSRKLLEPHYQLTFTCVPCGSRSTHAISKQGYHHGSVLITCPSCRNRHIISDNLKIFGEKNVTIEDIMKEKGQLVKRGTLGEDGDIEFWKDESASDASQAKEVSSPPPPETPTSPSAASLSGTSGQRPRVAAAPSPISDATPSTRRQYHHHTTSEDECVEKVNQLLAQRRATMRPVTTSSAKQAFRPANHDATTIPMTSWEYDGSLFEALKRLKAIRESGHDTLKKRFAPPLVASSSSF
ncbi:DNL zinc finger-domain-containing protein [Xylariales sp. PMI_506]|nr:DNL zinc finger-domain-containing protein [Xylariales sp. PMI_506]